MYERWKVHSGDAMRKGWHGEWMDAPWYRYVASDHTGSTPSPDIGAYDALQRPHQTVQPTTHPPRPDRVPIRASVPGSPKIGSLMACGEMVIGAAEGVLLLDPMPTTRSAAMPCHSATSSKRQPEGNGFTPAEEAEENTAPPTLESEAAAVAAAVRPASCSRTDDVDGVTLKAAREAAVAGVAAVAAGM